MKVRDELVRTGELLQGEGWMGRFGGLVPVQGLGEVDGRPFYFRSRHESWALSIAPVGGDPVGLWASIGSLPGFHHKERWPGGKDEAGWLTIEEVRACMEKAVGAFREAGRP